jgi:hypothetical protein
MQPAAMNPLCAIMQKRRPPKREKNESPGGVETEAPGLLGFSVHLPCFGGEVSLSNVLVSSSGL